jgi:FkbM family methyltransferase
MTRITQLTIYPLKSPRHGGQLRCAAIRERYREAGFAVETIAVMREDAYRTEREANDIALPTSLPGWKPHLARFIDLHTGECLARDDTAFAAFAALLERQRPDVVQLEQPWLYPAVRRWLAQRPDTAQSPLVVYSSQNIEWKLKRDESSASASDAAAAGEVARVEACERALAQAADLIVACTDAELGELRELAGNDRTHAFVTAANAIAPFTADPARTAAMRQRLGLDRYPLFVGSAHPPNVDGFWQMLAPSLAFLRPDEKIVVAGSVGHILRQHRTYAAWPGINESRLALLGEIEHADLVGLIGGAAAILLPITTGGGSNLKTAEAIYSGKPVLATPHALRGYGDASHWPTVTVAADADTFRRSLRDLLDRPSAPPPAEHAHLREEVTWQRALAPLVASIEALSGRTPARPSLAPTSADGGGGRPDVRARLAAISAAIARNGGVDYEQLLERQYVKLLRPGDTVVDVGAHAGRHLAKFIGCVGREGRVFGFEPLPDMHTQLLRRFGARNVMLHNVALSDSEGRVSFVHAKGAPEESGLRQRTYNDPRKVTPTAIEVLAQRLDGHIDALGGLRFIKIDVEGAEMNVLRGAEAVLARHRPIVSVEYGRPAYGAYGHDTFTLFDFAGQHGYAMYDIFAHRLDRDEWGIACDSVYWDYFMVPFEQEAEFARAVPPLAPDDLG